MRNAASRPPSKKIFEIAARLELVFLNPRSAPAPRLLRKHSRSDLFLAITGVVGRRVDRSPGLFGKRPSTHYLCVERRKGEHGEIWSHALEGTPRAGGVGFSYEPDNELSCAEGYRNIAIFPCAGEW